MSLILCASYLCVLCQPVCLPPVFFVPMRSCQACPISRWDIKGVWGASKSAGLRDKLHSPCPQLLSLIKPPGWHRERKKRAARGAGRLFWKKKKEKRKGKKKCKSSRAGHIVRHSALTVRSPKIGTRQELIHGVHRFFFFSHQICSYKGFELH